MYIATFCSPSIVKTAVKIGIDFHKLGDFIGTHILPAIEEWKDTQKQQLPSKSSASYITLSESHWLLKLIDFLAYNALLNMHQFQKSTIPNLL
jgi:hypothetical protein